jgi:hypothetical protein
MKENCRNCGAPHKEIICEYCGTYYGQKPLLKPYKKVVIESQPKKKTPWWFVFLLIIGAIIVLSMFIILKIKKTK